MKCSLSSLSSVLLLGVLLSACASREEANNRLSQSDLTPTGLLQNESPSEKNVDLNESISQDIAFSTLQDLKDQENLKNLELELTPPNRMPSQATFTSGSDKENLSAELFNAKAVTAQEGDCLTKLAQNYLGSSEEWPRIAHLNPQIKDPHQKIVAGEKVYVPATKSLNPQKISAFHESQSPESSNRGLASINSDDSKKHENKNSPLLRDQAFFKTNPSNYKNPINDQKQEQLKFAKYKKKKFKQQKVQNQDEREIASSEDESENDVALHTHENLSKAIGALGILMMLAVFLSFFLSKPEKK
jgi:hypothetical protein